MSSSEIRKFMTLLESPEAVAPAIESPGPTYYWSEGSGGQQLWFTQPVEGWSEKAVPASELTKPEAEYLNRFFAQNPHEDRVDFDTNDEDEVNELCKLVGVTQPYYNEWMNDPAAKDEAFDDYLMELDKFEEWEEFYHKFLNQYFPHFKLFALSGG